MQQKFWNNPFVMCLKVLIILGSQSPAKIFRTTAIQTNAVTCLLHERLQHFVEILDIITTLMRALDTLY